MATTDGVPMSDFWQRGGERLLVDAWDDKDYSIRLDDEEWQSYRRRVWRQNGRRKQAGEPTLRPISFNEWLEQVEQLEAA